jgi:hypothetical protein
MVPRNGPADQNPGAPLDKVLALVAQRAKIAGRCDGICPSRGNKASLLHDCIALSPAGPPWTFAGAGGILPLNSQKKRALGCAGETEGSLC